MWKEMKLKWKHLEGCDRKGKQRIKGKRMKGQDKRGRYAEKEKKKKKKHPENDKELRG